METMREAIAHALQVVDGVWLATPDDMAHTAMRNRLVMATQKLEEALDLVAAAESRRPR